LVRVPQVSSAHCELVTRIVKSGALPPPALDGLLRSVADTSNCVWSDLTVPVIAAALSALADSTAKSSGVRDRGPQGPVSDLSHGTAAALVQRLDAVVRASVPLRASLKVANLVHALATRHSAVVVTPTGAGIEATLRSAAAMLESFVARSAEAALNRAKVPR
jgi:hypothetical protein